VLIRVSLPLTPEIATVLSDLGSAAMAQGSVQWARAAYEAALVIRVARADRPATAAALQDVGSAALRQGQIPQARIMFEESLEIRRELGDQGGIALALNGLELCNDLGWGAGSAAMTKGPFRVGGKRGDQRNSRVGELAVLKSIGR